MRARTPPAPVWKVLVESSGKMQLVVAFVVGAPSAEQKAWVSLKKCFIPRIWSEFMWHSVRKMRSTTGGCFPSALKSFACAARRVSGLILPEGLHGSQLPFIFVRMMRRLVVWGGLFFSTSWSPRSPPSEFTRRVAVWGVWCGSEGGGRVT